MRLRRVLIGLALVTLAAGTCAGVAVAARPALLDEESQFICTSCHEPLELVSSPQAQSEKAFLNGLIHKGLSQSQIKRQMVAAYGVEVLARPPASGFNLTVYILPPALLLVGVAFLLYSLPKWRERSRRAAATKLPSAAPPDATDAQRLDDELARFI